MLKVDKRELSCFGYYDDDFPTCVECYDSKCRKATDERISKEDEGNTNADSD